MNLDSFIESLLGKDGADVLEKASKRLPEIKHVLLPRILMSWINIVGKSNEFNSNLPGINESNLTLNKSETNLFDGTVKVGSNEIEFGDADFYNLIGIIGIALDHDPKKIKLNINKNSLAKLGKSIDLLIKSKFITKQLKLKQETKKSLFASTEKPIKINKSFKLKKTLLNSNCSMCGMDLYINKKLSGCLCIKDLLNKTNIEEVNDSINLTFPNHFDEEEIGVILTSIKGKDNA